jgi:ferredoxin-NADP reductase
VQPLATAADTTGATSDTMSLRVERSELVADDIRLLALVDSAGAALPAWEPGAHLELHLPSSRIRQYSLCGDANDRYSYTVAVLRVADGRGGSIEIHDTALEGQILSVRGPISRFRLVDAPRYLLLAGGIGVTPIVAMVRELSKREASWRMIYATRTASARAFSDELAGLSENVTLTSDDVDGIPDFGSLIAVQPEGTAVYCCGPEPMIAAVEGFAAANPSVTLYTERFAASQNGYRLTGADAPFDIELRRRGVVVRVGADDSALDVVREVVPNHPYSCHEGICGSCEVSVLSGQIDHRDEVLSDEERDANDVMLLCVSRAHSERLVIDL